MVKRAALLLLGLLGIMVLRVEVVEAVRVSSDSMSPTLHRGDIVVVYKSGRAAQPGDLVTFSSPVDGSRNLKRIVGAPGDVVDIRDAVLHRDGRRIDEPYVDQASSDALYYGPVAVPPGFYLVLGDKRAGSVDSREYGPVPADSITGRVVGTIWPLR